MTRYATVALLLLGTLACSKKQAPEPSPSASAKVESALQGDPALTSQLKAIAQECVVDPKVSTVSCSGGQQQRLLGEFISNRRSKIAALDTLSSALASTDTKLQTVAASILYDAFRGNLGQNVEFGAVTQKQARQLVDQLPKLPKPQARQVAPAATHASVLARDLDHLYPVLDAEPSLAAAGYRYLMVHGRLDTFEKIKALATDKRPPIVLSALDAPRSMPNWSTKDRSAICPWAQPLLSSEAPLVASKAAGLLSHCTGEFVDGLLAEGERALASGKFSKAQISAFRDLCGAQRRRSGGATDEQCKRNRKLLEAVIKAEKIDLGTRSMALFAIAYQWPDEDALSLAKQLSKSSDAELAQAGAQTVARLQSRSATQNAGTPFPQPSPASSTKTAAPARGAPAAPIAPQ